MITLSYTFKTYTSPSTLVKTTGSYFFFTFCLQLFSGTAITWISRSRISGLVQGFVRMDHVKTLGQDKVISQSGNINCKECFGKSQNGSHSVHVHHFLKFSVYLVHALVHVHFLFTMIFKIVSFNFEIAFCQILKSRSLFVHK